MVAAYRDRYRITDDTPLGAPPESAAQKIDARASARPRSTRYVSSALMRAVTTEVGLQAVRRDQPGPGRSI